MRQETLDVFVTDWDLHDTTPETEPLPECPAPDKAGRPSTPATDGRVALWSYDPLTQHEAEADAARRGLAFENCERPEELAGCRLAILMLDHLHPWGDAESIYQAAVEATADAGTVLVGVSYDEEHPLAGRLRVVRSVAAVLDAVAAGRLP
jgi:hypothetical protein